MKKLFIIFIIGVFLNIGQNAHSQIRFNFSSDKPEYTASEELDKKLLDQTVSIILMGDGLGTCSGTVINEVDGNHEVLTAKHCIGVTEEMYVEHNKVLYVIVSATDDLALIIVDGKIKNKKVAKLSVWSAEIGDTVYHVAYPSGILYKASGEVTRNSKDWQFANFKAIGGCSGGGVFDIDGDLVSVLWGGYNGVKKEMPMKTVTEPLNDVKAFLMQIGHQI